MEKKDSTQLLLIIFVILTFALGGFVFYDKVLKKETKTIETGNNDNSSTNCPPCEKCNNTPSQCNCPNSSNRGVTLNSLKEFKITNVNQTVKVGNKELKLRIGKHENHDDVLFINDDVAWTNNDDDDFAHVDNDHYKVYVTDKFILITQTAQCDIGMYCAFDEDGNEIVINDNMYNFGSNSLKLNNGILSAKGGICSKAEYDSNLVIKYIDHTLIVTKAN